MKYHMIHLHNVKICHKCEKLFICIENLKNHIDQCDSNDLSDINMNDSEYEDILAEIMNEPEDIWGHSIETMGPIGLVSHLPNILWIESAFVVNNLVCKHTKEMGSIVISVTPIPYCDVLPFLIYCKIYT